jgi:pimeloyl-ACP methyl ester carboxylesterase
VSAPRAEPFEIAIPDADLGDLRERLQRARFADDFANEDWRYGVEGTYLRALVDYWLEGYDWRAREREMNTFSHFRVALDGVPIHFIHERGRGPSPVPLVLTHGWPWTFWDYAELIRPLADPGAHGGDAADAFHVVVPSLPGYGFSTPLRRPGVTWARTAELWLQLMSDVLGYERFAAQGGDWGALVTAELGHRFADRLHGIHVTLPGHPAFGFQNMKPEDFGPDERDLFATMGVRAKTATAHLTVHSSDPQTLAYAFHDSPIGLAAWIVERRRAWSDCDGDVERRFTKDDLLDTVMLYWLTGSIGTSMRFYWENMRLPWKPAHDRQPAIEAPTGIAVFPKELLFLPRKLAERNANLTHWTRMESGGHFAPAEEPELLVEDIRACFRPLRS